MRSYRELLLPDTMRKVLPVGRSAALQGVEAHLLGRRVFVALWHVVVAVQGLALLLDREATGRLLVLLRHVPLLPARVLLVVQ